MHWYLDVLKKYATFDGRATRSEFWMFILINTLIMVIPFLLIGFLGAGTGEPSDTVATILGLWLIFVIIYAIAVFIPTLAVTTRRLHDGGNSGWWQLLNFVPLGGIVLLIFEVLPGTRGPNKYGEDPLERDFTTPAPQAKPTDIQNQHEALQDKTANESTVIKN